MSLHMSCHACTCVCVCARMCACVCVCVCQCSFFACASECFQLSCSSHEPCDHAGAMQAANCSLPSPAEPPLAKSVIGKLRRGVAINLEAMASELTTDENGNLQEEEPVPKSTKRKKSKSKRSDMFGDESDVEKEAKEGGEKLGKGDEESVPKDKKRRKQSTGSNDMAAAEEEAMVMATKAVTAEDDAVSYAAVASALADTDAMQNSSALAEAKEHSLKPSDLSVVEEPVTAVAETSINKSKRRTSGGSNAASAKNATDDTEAKEKKEESKAAPAAKTVMKKTKRRPSGGSNAASAENVTDDTEANEKNEESQAAAAATTVVKKSKRRTSGCSINAKTKKATDDIKASEENEESTAKDVSSTTKPKSGANAKIKVKKGQARGSTDNPADGQKENISSDSSSDSSDTSSEDSSDNKGAATIKVQRKYNAMSAKESREKFKAGAAEHGNGSAWVNSAARRELIKQMPIGEVNRRRMEKEHARLLEEHGVGTWRMEKEHAYCEV